MPLAPSLFDLLASLKYELVATDLPLFRTCVGAINSIIVEQDIERNIERFCTDFFTLIQENPELISRNYDLFQTAIMAIDQVMTQFFFK